MSRSLLTKNVKIVSFAHIFVKKQIDLRTSKTKMNDTHS